LKTNKVINRIDKTLQHIIEDEKDSWNHRFLVSVREQIVEGRELSPSQLNFLNQIEGAYTPEAILAKNSWIKEWKESADIREQFELALRYYKRTGYYSTIVARYLLDGKLSGIPPKKAFNKIVNNRYFQGVYKVYKSNPKFEEGTAVRFGAKAPRSLKNLSGGIVISTEIQFDDITSYAKGSRPVTVLPFTLAQTIKTEERCLKKMPKVYRKKR